MHRTVRERRKDDDHRDHKECKLVGPGHSLVKRKSSYQIVPEIGHSSPHPTRPVRINTASTLAGAVKSTVTGFQSAEPGSNGSDAAIPLLSIPLKICRRGGPPLLRLSVRTMN